MEKHEVKAAVAEHYATIVKEGRGCCDDSCCSETDTQSLSESIGYSKDELASIPAEANLGLGCGNPQAIAELKPGEHVLDLGSGGGLDSFLAARQVGPTGSVIGIDMTTEMIHRARQNARKGDYRNVTFRLGEIEHLPVENDSIDVILSNCVINLSPDKPAVYREAFRVLKPGGRLAISDMVALKPLPKSLTENPAAYPGCIAGAETVDCLKEILAVIGFSDIRLTLKTQPAATEDSCCDSPSGEGLVVSADIRATKRG